MSEEIFDIENYKGAYVMHCDTEEKANTFLKYLDSAGETWKSGCSYINNARWGEFKADTCYAFNKGQYYDLNFYRLYGFEILEFDDFYWGEEIFDIENYKGAYVMHCDTKEKADVFIKYLNSVEDNLWRVNLCNPNITFWWVNGEKTCYNFNIGTFGSIGQFEEKNYKTLEFDDFVWGEENSPKEDSIQEALQKVEDAKQKEAHEFLQGKKKELERY